MNLLRCIIVEDEPLAQKVLEKYICEHDQLTLIKSCRTAVDALRLIDSHEIDIMFLDIEMPSINGIDFLKALDNPPKIILTTAYAEYAAMSYELEVIDYLLKPFNYERFKKSINKVHKIKEIPEETKPDYIFIKFDGKLCKINFSEIVYVEAMRDYLKVFTDKRPYITHMTMKSMEELLYPNDFMRIHRSYIISLSKAVLISNKYIELKEAIIPIGELYKEKIKEYVKRLQSY